MFSYYTCKRKKQQQKRDKNKMDIFIFKRRSAHLSTYVWSKPLLRAHFTNRKWKPTENEYTIAAMLINGLKPPLFILFYTKCASTNWKPAAVSSFHQVSSLQQRTLLNTGQVTRKCIVYSTCPCLGQLKPYSNFFVETCVIKPF